MNDGEIRICIDLVDLVRRRKTSGSFDTAAVELVQEEFGARGLVYEDFEVSKNYVDSNTIRTCYFKPKNLTGDIMANPQVVKTQHRRPFPFADGIILEENREEVSAGGILIPEATKEMMKQKGQQELQIDIGKVLAIGEGQITDAGVRIPMPIKPGDMVAYGRHRVLKYELDGETYLIASLGSIIAKISEGPYSDQPMADEVVEELPSEDDLDDDGHYATHPE